MFLSHISCFRGDIVCLGVTQAFHVQVATAAAMDKHPICFRFPRGNGIGVDLASRGITNYKGTPIEVPRETATLGDIRCSNHDITYLFTSV